ncbi:uncharacterized protein LOC114516792 [Dendronephthya gigantea]|uniref:uncharacterized protein LOC114516792 n=1 Tax=Dendronephthya gigantea TaxID=151771 RepID=UPI00106A8DFA|nr:uncharacterized protein LOC114516792 [Dendronephthya gigantea]
MAYASKKLFRTHSLLDRVIHNEPWDIPKFNAPSGKKDIWEDHFEQGLRHLDENEVNLAEQSLSKALKILSASPMTKHLNKEKATCFHAMAEIYSTRASQQMDDDGFCEMMVKSIALFEAERIYKHGSYKADEEIDTAIFEAEVKFINKVFGAVGVDHYKKMENKKNLNREKLEEIRLKQTNEYFPALDRLPDWNSRDEERRCQEIEKIYKQIDDDMKCLVNEIFSYCCEIAGSAPCKFSIIGLGSMSRQEITPYSDLEFAVLVESKNKSPSSEQRQYFRFLTYLIQAQIIKLGETILPSVGISSLNNFYSGNIEDDWFYDDVIPKGFSFDGMMPWACKTPLGRKEWRGQPRQEYIMTVDEMLTLQDVIPGSALESLKTANVFSSVCHLFGDEELTKSYEQKLSSLVTNTERRKSFQEQVIEIMQGLLNTYNLRSLLLCDSGTQQDVKKEVYRLASLLVEQLSKYFGIFGRSSWRCIDEMNVKKILTEDGAKNLQVMLSITTELRLKCYQRQGRQKEALPTVPQLSVTEEKCTPCSFTSAIVRLYKSLVPLSSTMSNIVSKIKNPHHPVVISLTSKPDVNEIAECLKNVNLRDPEKILVKALQQETFLDVSSTTTAIAYLRVLQLPKAIDCLLSAKDDSMDFVESVSIRHALTHCYMHVGKFQEAINCCREMQTLHTLAPDFVKTSDVIDALISIMDAYIHQGLLNEAVNVHTQIVSLQDQQDSKDTAVDERKVNFLTSSAVLFIELEQYDKAEIILRTILKGIKNHRKQYLVHFMTLNNLAVVLLCENKFEEAKTILNDALQVAGELYGENAAHPDFANCLTNLSEVYYYLQNMKEAERFVRLALVIYSQLHDYVKELVEPGIVDALIIKARIHQFYKQRDDVFSTLSQANEISKNLYGGQPHPHIASIILHLGVCEQERENFSEALNHYQEYLKIHENQRLECQETGEDCKMANVLVRIANLGAVCCYDPSYLLTCNEKALKIEEKIHGKEANHVHLAMCFGSLGFCLMAADRESEGVDYFCRFLKMFEEINLGSNKAFGRAHLLIGEIFGQHSPGKAEKHLRSAEKVLKKVLKDESDVSLLQINSSLLEIFAQTSRMKEGLELAEKQRRLIDIMLSKSNSPSAHQLSQVFRLASFYEDSGRRNTARDLFIDLIGRIEEQVDTADSDQDYFELLLWTAELRAGGIYRTNGMFDHAEAMFQRILLSVKKTTSQRQLGKEFRHVALYNLSCIFTQTGRYHQAHELLDSLINLYEQDPKSIDPEAASYVFLIRSELNRKTLCFNLALEDLEKALKTAEVFRLSKSTITSATEILYAKVMNTFGLVHEENNNLSLALDYYTCSLSTVDGLPPKMDTAIFHQNKADVLKALGRFEDATIHYQKSLEIREMLYSEDPVREDIATVLYHLALTQYISRQPNEASKTLEKLLPLRRELLKEGGSNRLQNYAAALVLKGGCHISEPDEAQQAKEAFEEAEKVLKLLTEGQLNQDYAAVLHNLGSACFMLNQWEEAIPKLKNALEMRRIIYEGKAVPDVASTCEFLATALFKNHEYQKALTYFEEALKYFEVCQSPDNETKCALHIALCHKSLKNFDLASKAFEKVKVLCARESVSDEMRDEVQETMAENEENTNKPKDS